MLLSYIVGFFVMLTLLGWQPHEPQKTEPQKVPGISQLPHTEAPTHGNTEGVFGY